MRRFLYDSGLLDRALCPGLRAPRCYLVEALNDDLLRLWLEDVRDRSPSVAKAANLATAARGIGRFNGAFVRERRVADAAWLCQRFLRGWLNDFGHHPPADTHSALSGRLIELWRRRDALLARSEILPVTFCHRDTYRPNLVLAPDLRDDDSMVLLDWAYAGPGPIGSDASALAFGSLLWLAIEPLQVRQFIDDVYAAYVAGVRESGCDVPEYSLREGFILSGVLRWIVGRHAHMSAVLEPDKLDDAHRDALERDYQRPIDAILTTSCAVVEDLLNLSTEVPASV